MFKFRSGINGLNEELGVNTMIGSVNYVVMIVKAWCMSYGSVLYNYDSIRNTFMVDLQKSVG